MVVLCELLIIWFVKLLQAIAMTMGMGVVCVCMMGGLRFALGLVARERILVEMDSLVLAD